VDTFAPIATTSSEPASGISAPGALRALAAAVALLCAATLLPEAHAAGIEAGECARNMVREPFAYLTPPPKYRDPRTLLPQDLTIAQRRELHPVLWPSDFSARMSVRQWLFERNFACMEEGFADLLTTQARYPDGTLKLVSFLGGARDFVDASRGMTEGEIDELIEAWRSQHPSSLLSELLWPRMLTAAAWNERGTDWAGNVAPERMREFRRLSAVAMQRAQALSPAARGNVLGHYVGLRAIADNGASVEQIEAFALDGLRHFPHETGLAAIAGERMLPKWGGSPSAFEDFALAARNAVGPPLADRIYASLYLQVVGIEELHLHPEARLAGVKAGLMDLAGSGSYDGILALREFACTLRDDEALRRAQSLWKTYAAEPQLRSPQTDLDARCRAWERSLPAVDRPTSVAARQTLGEPTPATVSIFRPVAPQEVARTLYDIQAGAWERLKTPMGEVFTCKACEYPVQVLMTVGPPLVGDAEFSSNERFLATLDSLESRARTARAHTEQSAQLDPAKSNEDLKIEKTEFAEVDGVKAFRYESVLRLPRVTMRETALELVHKGRMLRIAVDRADGPVGRKEQEAVQALIGNIKLRRE
jgi:hypothetical protein